MPSKRPVYSLKILRHDYTYSAYEIADLYNITPNTVFRWIRDEGLKRIPGPRKYYVHSSELRRFLEQRNHKNKKPCKAGEIYCCKCKAPRTPKPASIKSKKQPNKTIRVSGNCLVCNTRMNIIVSSKKWGNEHPFHPDNNTPTSAHNGEHKTLHKCQTEGGKQLCLNLTP